MDENNVAINGKVIIVSKKESFSVIGLMQKLSESEIDARHVEPNLSTLKMAGNNSIPIVYYVGDEIYSNRGAKFAEDLKTFVFDNDRILIVVCEKAEYDKLTEFLPKTAIARFFLRPVDMSELISTIRDGIRGYILPKKRHHILIVDDDKTYMRMLKEALNDEYKITMMDSGTQAIRWLCENRVDLILLDYKMPVMDGPLFYQMMKSDDEMRHIPIIFLTGVQERDSVMKVLDLNPEDYILKSVDEKKLREKLERFFVRRKKKAEEDSEALPNKDEIEALLAELNLM